MDSLEQRRRELSIAWAAWLLAAVGWGVALLPAAPAHPPGLFEEVCAAECASSAARLLFGETLDLNHANADQLEVLPGIGPARAQAIVEERERRHFQHVDELRAVRGIGPRTVAGLEGWVHIGPLRFDETAPDG